MAVGAGKTKTLDRGIDQTGIDLLDGLPWKTEPIEHPWSKIFGQHVSGFEQLGKNLFALWGFQVEGYTALVAVQHGEIQAVNVRDIPQLATRDIAAASRLDLDDVSAEKTQNLGARRTG